MIHFRETPDDRNALCGLRLIVSSEGTPFPDLVTCPLCVTLAETFVPSHSVEAPKPPAAHPDLRDFGSF